MGPASACATPELPSFILIASLEFFAKVRDLHRCLLWNEHISAPAHDAIQNEKTSRLTTARPAHLNYQYG